LADENRNVNVITEAMAAKASAIGIDELKTVTAKPTASPTAAEMAIWRHFGETVANREVDFIGAPISSLAQQIPFSK
jgi:hypothetical protein